MSEAKTLLRMGALALMWGSSFFWVKLALAGFSPVQLVLGRVALGATVLVILCYANRDRLPRSRRVWLHLVVAAFFHNALPFLLFAIGEQTVDSGITGVINATTPLWALLMALLLRSETRLGRNRGLGLLIGMVGTIVIFAPWEASGLLSLGALACLVAAISYGFVFVYEGRFLTNIGVSPIALAGAQMISASGFLIFAMPIGGLSPVTLNGMAILAIVIIGVFSTGIAFALNYRLLASEGAVATSMVGYLLPIVSIMLGTMFLGESVNLREIIGMFVVLGGIALTRTRQSRQQDTDGDQVASSVSAPTARKGHGETAEPVSNTCAS